MALWSYGSDGVPGINFSERRPGPVRTAADSNKTQQNVAAEVIVKVRLALPRIPEMPCLCLLLRMRHLPCAQPAGNETHLTHILGGHHDPILSNQRPGVARAPRVLVDILRLVVRVPRASMGACKRVLTSMLTLALLRAVTDVPASPALLHSAQR